MYANVLGIAAVAWLLASACGRSEADTDALTPHASESSGSSVASWLEGRRGLYPIHVRRTAVAAPTYTIVDVGAPTLNSHPVGFKGKGHGVLRLVGSMKGILSSLTCRLKGHIRQPYELYGQDADTGIYCSQKHVRCKRCRRHLS